MSYINLKKKKLTRKERKALRKAELEKIKAEKQAKEYRYRIIKSTQEIIPIKDIFDGIIITKDNRYIKLMEFKPLNFTYASAEMQNRIISQFMSMMQSTPVSLHFKIISRKADVDYTISVVKKYYNKESNPARKELLLNYMDLLKKTALSVGISRSFFIAIEFKPNLNNDGSNFEGIAADLKSVAARIRTYMENAGNFFIPSCEKDDTIHEVLYQILNRKKAETVPFSEHADAVIKPYLNEVGEDGELPTILSPEFIAPAWIDFTHYNHIVIDDKFYTFGYIESNGYNAQVYAGWMALFVNAGEGIDLDIFLVKYPKEEVYNKIGMQVRLKRANALDSADTDSDYYQRHEAISSGTYMLQGLSSGEDFYYLSTFITVVADSLPELEYKYKELERRVKGVNMKMRRCSFMMEESFESMFPLCHINKSIFQKSRRNVLSSGAASCYPFISYEMQDPNGIMVGTNKMNNSLVSVDVFDTDIHPNANAVILGSSGYGKTFTSQLFALRMSAMDVQTFVIAPLKGVEDYMGGCHAINGQFVSMDPSSSNHINIFDVRVPDEEDLKKMDGYIETSYLTKKIHTIKTFLNLIVRDITQEEEMLMDTALYTLYGRFGITTNNESLFDSVTHDYKKMPILCDFYAEISNIPELTRVKNILSPFVNGSMSTYNHQTNVDLYSKYIVFDFNGLKGEALILSMFVALDFVWNKIKEDRTKRKAVFIDECWKLIGTDSNQRAAEDVVEIFRTIRAYGGSAFAMTQDISQFFEYENGKYGKAVIGNADTKIILHLQPNEAYKLQEAIQLTDAEVDTITKLPRGQGLVASSGSKLFVDFIASDYEAKAITTDAKSFYEAAQAEQAKKQKES